MLIISWFPGSSEGEESAYGAGDPGSIPGSGRFPWREEGMAMHSSILAWRIPMDRGAWWVTVIGVERAGSDFVTKHST